MEQKGRITCLMAVNVQTAAADVYISSESHSAARSLSFSGAGSPSPLGFPSIAIVPRFQTSGRSRASLLLIDPSDSLPCDPGSTHHTSNARSEWFPRSSPVIEGEVDIDLNEQGRDFFSHYLPSTPHPSWRRLLVSCVENGCQPWEGSASTAGILICNGSLWSSIQNYVWGPHTRWPLHFPILGCYTILANKKQSEEFFFPIRVLCNIAMPSNKQQWTCFG